MALSTLARRATFAVALILGLAITAPAFATPADRTNADDTGLMLRGYDPVAYFTLGKPTEGSPEITAEHDGGTYRFVSTEHRDLFVANPSAYAPAYGGFCAFGTAMGRKFDGDPEAWSIVDDRLYVNLNQGVRERWLGNPEGFIRTAEHNWPIIVDVPDTQLEASPPSDILLGAN